MRPGAAAQQPLRQSGRLLPWDGGAGAGRSEDRNQRATALPGFDGLLGCLRFAVDGSGRLDLVDPVESSEEASRILRCLPELVRRWLIWIFFSIIKNG